MNQLDIYDIPETPYFSEQRKIQRHDIIHLLAITERGTGQVLDISREGLSFGCLYPHAFQNEFYVDILDTKGSHIKKLKVRKMWETSGHYKDSSSMFELVVGVEFAELTSDQSDELNYLFANLEVIDYSYPQII
jgi:hypothetical protein